MEDHALMTQREQLWRAFLNRWPLEALQSLPLSEYTQPDNKDTFAYWIEFGTQLLGSMRGGGAFKFGIYQRKGPIKEKRDYFKHDATYSWYAKYGATYQEAYDKVRTLIVECATAARQGDLARIDALDLGDVFKWKLAFLYQPPDTPVVLPIYKIDHLRAALGPNSKGVAYPELYRQLLVNRGKQPFFEYANLLWASIAAALETQLMPEEALAYFHEHPSRFVPIKPPSQYIAGFAVPTGQHIALVRDNRETTLFLSPGEWLDSVRSQLGKVDDYPPERSRNSNLNANAPALAQGRPAIMVRVPTKAALIALCDAYLDIPALEESTVTTPSQLTSPTDAPLNQILYGPPGTGKTYATVDTALSILDPAYLEANHTSRPALKTRFDALMEAGHIRFVTFHQSFSYEDFVEGLRAQSDTDGHLRYEVVPGMFKSLCNAASARITQQAQAPVDLKGRRIWKMSLGNSLGSDAYIYDECIEQNYALLGYGETIDFTGCMTREAVFEQFASAGRDVTQDSYAVTAVTTFVAKVKPGDLLVVTEGNSKFRAIGEVTGDYQCLNRQEQGDDYGQCRPVKWLRVYQPALPHDELMHNQFSQMTLYELKPSSIDMNKMAGLLGAATIPAHNAKPELPFQTGESFARGYVVRNASSDVLELEKPNGNRLPLGMSLLQELASYVRSGRLTLADIRDKQVFEKVPETKLEPYLVNGYNNILAVLVERLCQPVPANVTLSIVGTESNSAKVLIIDEINRGNVARIFGELITLIEPSKRQGAEEALEVTLPYSKERFSVPRNVYLIGTMNTADRSLSGLDIALRRRFTFKEMAPQPALLDKVAVEGIPIGDLLRTINQRIEALLDRDHCLGHAYFLPLRDAPTLPHLGSIFRLRILPLLQEYFFEDWERIRWILNDHRKPIENQFIVPSTTIPSQLFGDALPGLGKLGLQWHIQPYAFDAVGSYAGVIAA